MGFFGRTRESSSSTIVWPRDEIIDGLRSRYKVENIAVDENGSTTLVASTLWYPFRMLLCAPSKAQSSAIESMCFAVTVADTNLSEQDIERLKKNLTMSTVWNVDSDVTLFSCFSFNVKYTTRVFNEILDVWDADCKVFLDFVRKVILRSGSMVQFVSEMAPRISVSRETVRDLEIDCGASVRAGFGKFIERHDWPLSSSNPKSVR